MKRCGMPNATKTSLATMAITVDIEIDIMLLSGVSLGISVP
jgi:hypothetical protein